MEQESLTEPPPTATTGPSVILPILPSINPLSHSWKKPSRYSHYQISLVLFGIRISTTVSRHKLYYLSQGVGWTTYILVSLFLNILLDNPINKDFVLMHCAALVIGLVISHGYRELIVRMGWLSLDIIPLIPRILISSLSLAVIFNVLYSLAHFAFTSSQLTIDWRIMDLGGWSMLFIIWALIYFAFHFFTNYRKEEIKNLKWEAAANEFELNRLKSQLNPHFIFNAMNTIRALVDEEPVKAKRSITQLSNILRNSLQTGKQKVVPLRNELNLVRDYLEIEQSRYEERLKVDWNLDESCMEFPVPPLMVQTLVENAIKHGISKLTQGGTITIATARTGENLRITIQNHGQYHLNGTPASGFGLVNTRQRLQLLYGDNGSFNIKNLNNEEVVTQLTIPPQSQSIDEDPKFDH